MADGNRIYPVDYLIIHHSAGGEFIDWFATTVQDAFSRVGKTKEYKNILHSGHWHLFREKETFAMVQFALHKYDNKWRVVELMRDPWNCVAWHAGNLKINRRSVGIEICGNYEKREVEIGALEAIAEYFKPWRKELEAKGIEPIILGHKDVSKSFTVCPGMIHGQLPLLKSMIFKE